jgi:hypothetical protein
MPAAQLTQQLAQEMRDAGSAGGANGDDSR